VRKLVSSLAKAAHFSFQNPKFYTKGLSYYRKENWTVAKEYFEKVLAEDKRHAPSLFKLGMCHFRQKHYDDALLCIAQALQVDPSQTQWQHQLDQTIRHVSKSAALPAAKREQLIREQLGYLDNPSAELYNQLAHALRKQGKWWQEIEVLQNATTLEPNHPTWFFRLGEAQEVMSRFQQAAHSFGKAITLKQDKADAYWYYRLGFCYQREGHDGPANLARAKAAYRKAINKDGKLHTKRFGIGVFHQQRGYWSQARDAYSAQLERRPWDAELNYRLAMAHDRCYEWAEAEACYKNALTIDIEQPDWHYRLGFVLERQEKFDDAALAYQFAAQNRDRHTPYWFYRWGYVLEQQERYEEAVDAYLQTRLQPMFDASGPMEKRGLSQSDLESSLAEYAQQFQRRRFIIDARTRQLEQDTTDPERWYQLGNSYELEGEWEQAADAYQQAVMRQNKHTPEWYYQWGYSLFQIGLFKESCEAFREQRILKKPYGISEKILNSETKRLHAHYSEHLSTSSIIEKTVLFESNHGKSMTCNPLAIFENILTKNTFDDWLFIWVVNDLSAVNKDYKKYKNIVFISRSSDAYFKWLARAHYLINNSGFPYYFVRRAEQKYLETWHGTPFKTLGKQQRYKFFSHRGTQRNLFQATHIISPNKHTTDVFLRDYELDEIYTGEIKETGYPRLDKTINKSAKSIASLKEKLGLDSLKPVVLYAPTWRGDLENLNLDFEMLNKTINKLSSDSYQVLFRGHNYLEGKLEEFGVSCKIVPPEISTNDLLPLIEVLVTDYSSIFFDFAPLKRPIILYAYDLEDYVKDRGLYFTLDNLGLAHTDRIDELSVMVEDAIESKTYVPSDEFLHTFCQFDDGLAAERVVEFLFRDEERKPKHADKNGKLNALIFPGSMEPNGITTSFINLINHIQEDRASPIKPIIALAPNAINDDVGKLSEFNKIDYSNSFFARYGYMVMGLEEIYLRNRYSTLPMKDISNEELNVLRKCYKREFWRVFGGADIDICINFSGYDSFWCSLFALSEVENNVCYLHNDLCSEYASRFSYLSYNFSILRFYRLLASVSKMTCSLNKEKLSSSYNISSEKFDFIDNLQSPEYVLKKSEEALSNEDVNLFSESETVFITIGRLSVEKDHKKLILAFKEVQKSTPAAKLLILGDGPLKHDLVKLVESNGLRNKVHLLGRRKNPFPLLKKADCFVLSSNHEGQPMVLFEAMILKKPIISTDIVGSRSALTGRTGILVDNTIMGLATAMISYSNGQLNFPEYDITDYQESAINMFYNKIVGVENE